MQQHMDGTTVVLHTAFFETLGKRISEQYHWLTSLVSEWETYLGGRVESFSRESMFPLSIIQGRERKGILS